MSAQSCTKTNLHEGTKGQNCTQTILHQGSILHELQFCNEAKKQKKKLKEKIIKKSYWPRVSVKGKIYSKIKIKKWIIKVVKKTIIINTN